MNSYVNMILFYSFAFFLINLEFWVLLLGLCEQCHEALCVRNNTSSFCKVLATNSLQTQTSNSQRPVPHACSALCWQKAGPTHPGLSADQRSSVWRWKFWFFLTSDLFVEHVSTTVHHQKLISAVWWQSVWDSCFQGNKAKEKRLWVKHLPVYLFNLQPPVSSSWSHRCPAALNLSFVILGTNKEKAVRWCSIKSENVRTLTQETENLVLCETTSWVENIT